METRDIQLGPKKSEQILYDVRCPYRGVYTVGLHQLMAWDLFGWISFTFPVFSRTFYVYPRVIPLHRAFLGYGKASTAQQYPRGGTEADWTLYRELRQYRPDDNARHISWKHMALSGEPLVREYDTSAQQSVTICLDMRPVPSDLAETALNIEDTSIEITVSLVKYYLDHHVPVILVRGGTLIQLHPDDHEAFSRFLKSTLTFFFHSSVSPARSYDMLRTETRRSSGSVLFITHQLDAEVLELVQRSDSKHLDASAVINTRGLSPQQHKRAQVIQHAHSGHPGALITVDSADDLQGKRGS